ncbi:MAG: hypothetical protein A3H59_00465 [Candidatus Jacksonbacteria bacterium RIFCSPLOWO2_02_FULL_43_9]|uniref:Uncharacterized protein n=1 Tax=Candidatus Falkowbacteria bacterium GW2011_GWA2_41_14 TaxID=1618635 RepID=A0A0G0US63_9BACT|nr:MAG: hypothetical protein UU43_C0004G0026 [Candidatus Falkowbacteria bacterium GW2011_GWA2_41_14]OGY68927.1 MAG: hypothetical protein A3B94_02530 [Candidatus Jacksonbacteria bacterium RIFCSPHIGHO2_02_FULL_43_10]OGY70933.1 MAG: hypothetical protein A2986_01355 [Candidatus Jacksonbacteria bacterium RIFCSPLOWO2_01_FULL_44_13]OGY71796.1 MAG: hypothetical protein A3H59_00465 [Candidatus Jacksonbacteria bacterium RIFCSPLOWO2_02_FULL_43_9]HAZ16856.1 hypothetical protein [Candidatus Jacksonbacteria 
MFTRFFKWRRIRRSTFFAFFSYTSLIVSAGIVVGLSVWIWNVVKGLGTVIVPLHRTVYYGIDYLGQPSLLLFLPAFGLLMLCIHCGLGLFLYTRDRFFSYFLWTSVVLLELFLALGTVTIVRNL